MSIRGFSSVGAALGCAAGAAVPVAGGRCVAGSGSGLGDATGESAHTAGATAKNAPRSIVFFTTSSSLARDSFRVRFLPRAHLDAGGVEQPFVVPLAQLLARFGRELREERRVHVVDLQVFRLLRRRDLVGA